jgi:hypothetical protein
MKDKNWFVPQLALIVMVLVTLACGASSQATSTEAPSTTVSPEATQAYTPTVAPEALPDISEARIAMSELPAGFEEIPTDENTLGPTTSGEDEFQPKAIFLYANKDKFQMIFGMNFLLNKALDRVGFDLALGQPETTLKEFTNVMGGQNVRDQKILDGLDGVGETQIAMTMLADVKEIPMRVNVAMFRRGIAGGMILSMTLEGEPENISLQELGTLFDQHIQESLNAAE